MPVPNPLALANEQTRFRWEPVRRAWTQDLHLAINTGTCSFSDCNLIFNRICLSYMPLILAGRLSRAHG